jgi:hypothetical protein
MFNRSLLIRFVVAVVVIMLSAGGYLFFQLRTSLAGMGLGGDGDAIASDTASAARRDSIPAEFAKAFNTTIAIDTAHSASDALIIDTSYQANGRAGAIGGRKVTISVCGVDSRLNERVEHADANHVVTIWLDSGIVDIVSIPRDTPCDAGFPHNSNLNNLANLRARKGRDAYLTEVASIAGVDTINYYVELGFSQARGVLELLGFRNDAISALRVLRSRRAFASGDFQRSFNQGQFIRQMMMNQFGRLDGLTGNLLMRAALCLVTTNLTVDVLDSLHEILASKGFPKSRECVTVAIRPTYYAKMAVFNFGDSAVLGSLLHKIDDKAVKLGIPNGNADSALATFRRQVHALIAKAAADTAKKAATQ